MRQGSPRNPLDELLTTRKAAEYLGLKSQTLRKWRTLGGGPRYIRLGDGPRGRVVYRATDLMEWLDSRTYTNTAEETTTADF